MARGKTNQKTRTAAPRARTSANYLAINRDWPEIDFSWDGNCRVYSYQQTMIYLAPAYPAEAAKMVIDLLKELPLPISQRIKSVLLLDKAPPTGIGAVCDHQEQEIIFFGEKEKGKIKTRLKPITFFHEAAHLAEDLLAIDLPMDLIIQEYTAARLADYKLHQDNPKSIIIDDAHILIGEQQITEYAKENADLISEDWAESYALYLNQTSYQTEYDFETLYPARYAFIKKYLG